MREVLTSAQMRAIEGAAIASGAVSGRELMERAGRGVLEAIIATWPDLARVSKAGPARAPRRAVVLCGPGNNGGDGFVMARLLHGRGWRVAVYLFGDAARLPPDAAANYRRWSDLGTVAPLVSVPPDAPGADLIVDALFGTGLSRPVALPLGALAPASDGTTGPRVVAVDLPSGLCGDSGRVIGDSAVQADLTVTFHALKLGHVLAEGPQLAGRVVVHDIGLSSWSKISPPEASDRAAGPVRIIEAPTTPLAKSATAHKYDHGHALILAGGPGRGGAARLAARGALRIGAGLVTLACPPEALAENAAQLTAVMLRPVGDARALGRVLEDERINALCLGPGLGMGATCRELVAAALASARPLVLDADALTAFTEAPAALFEPCGRHRRCVLTPHAGEFARLFPDIAATLRTPATKGPACSKVDAARAAAARAGCVVLLKGPDTVIAAPDGRCSIHATPGARATPWLATAGAGDVLSGFIAGLLARGAEPMQAAETAAWLHAECARAFGPGLISEDLPEQVPRVLREMGP